MRKCFCTVLALIIVVSCICVPASAMENASDGEEMIIASSSSGTIIYQSTAQNQQSIYGKLVKGHKMTCDDHMLAKPGDNAIIKYTVSQPSDLTRTTGSKQVFNKYYFVIVGKNGLTFQFSDKKLTVEQYRDCSYRVS